MNPPRTAIYVARVHLGLGALIALAGLVAGLGLQHELWEPGAAGTGERYAGMLGLHGLLMTTVGAPALAGCFGYLAVIELVGARRMRAPAVAWVGLGLWVVGLGATVFAHALGPLAFAAAGLVYAGHLGSMIAANVRTVPPARVVLAATFAGAVAAACLGSIAALAGRGPSSPSVAALTMFVALVLATAALVRGTAPGAHALRTVLAIACAGVWSFTSLRLAGMATVALWISLVRLDAPRRPMVACVLLGIAPALLMHSFAGRIAELAGDGVYLHDTYFEVGMDHLVGMILGFAGLAAVHAWTGALGRTPHRLLASLGAILCSAGMLLHVRAMLHLGAAGMPRRYWDYDATFTAGHQRAGLGAALALAGLVLLGAAWVRSRRHVADHADEP